MDRAAPLYVRVMGDSLTGLAAPIRCMHATRSVSRARGRLRIEHGPRFARLIVRALGLPRASDAADTRLTITASEEREEWARTFDGRGFRTIQYETKAHELAELFGVIEFRFHLQASEGSLLYVQREASIRSDRVHVRIPSACAPRIEARVDATGPTRMHVDVRVSVPGIGMLISYAGIIEVEEMRV